MATAFSEFVYNAAARDWAFDHINLETVVSRIIRPITEQYLCSWN